MFKYAFLNNITVIITTRKAYWVDAIYLIGRQPYHMKAVDKNATNVALKHFIYDALFIYNSRGFFLKWACNFSKSSSLFLFNLSAAAERSRGDLRFT